ncbi:MAG: sugar porter family MFS transporter [Vampirovibrio sp.]|nr:sugar porter family MFS transporter [Vampirovibrio sp.]
MTNAARPQGSNETVNLGFVYLISSVAAIGGLLFGYDTGVIAGAIVFMEKKFALDPTMVGWTVSCALLGSIIGTFSAGPLSDWFGRKKILLLSAVLFSVSALATAIPNDISTFVVARMVTGIAIGIASMLSPLYIAELAPSSIRGRLVTLYQLAIVTGFFVVYFANLFITTMGDAAWGIDFGWRWMFATSVVPSLLFLGALMIVPESPRWLLQKGQRDTALETLTKVGGAAHAQAEAKEIDASLNEENENKGSILQLFEPGFRVALLIGVVLAVLQQVTGINAIMYYAPRIFESMGNGTDTAMMSTVWVGTVNLLFTFVALWLIDKVGRKALLLWGASGMAICLFGVGYAFQQNMTEGPWVLLCILGFVASFAASMGPVVWVLLSEIFPTRIRGRAMSIATMVLWFATLFVSQTFPMMLEAFGPTATFWCYMTMSVVTVVFVQTMVPETKGKSLEEIENLWTTKGAYDAEGVSKAVPLSS